MKKQKLVKLVIGGMICFGIIFMTSPVGAKIGSVIKIKLEDALYGNVGVNEKVTIGGILDKKKEGEADIRGFIKNSLANKPVMVKDSLKIKNDLFVGEDLKISGNLKGKDIVKTNNLANDAVTSAKILDRTITNEDVNFLSNGFVKAAVLVTNNGEIYRSFNNWGSPITVTKTETGEYDIDFGFDVSDRYVSIDVMAGYGSATPFNWAGTDSARRENIYVSTAGASGGSLVAQDLPFYLVIY